MGNRSKTILALQLLLVFYSTAGILSKLAASVDPISLEFAVLYLGILFILGIYAIGWQQILRRMPLTSAYANRAVIVVWGIVWGYVFFGESITLGKVAGAIIVMTGIILFSLADKDEVQGEVPDAMSDDEQPKERGV